MAEMRPTTPTQKHHLTERRSNLPNVETTTCTSAQPSNRVKSMCGCLALVTAIVLSLIVSLIAVSYAVIQFNNQQVTLQSVLEELYRLGSISNPASSCNDIPQDRPSGEYWILSSQRNSLALVHCDTNRASCSCNTSGGWMRVANLDMTDPNQNCPDGFRLVTRTEPPLRTCGSPESVRPGCVSTTYQTHGVEYSHVCGRVIGYQFGSPDAFHNYYTQNNTIDSYYLDGVSLTHGQLPRQHIWTFAAFWSERSSGSGACPCSRPDLSFSGLLPPFVGQDYFCATGSREKWQDVLYPDDPLWDGQGCGGNSTCCQFNNPPWFCKQLPQPTTNDIELRLCGNQDTVEDEDAPLEQVEIYIH